MTDEADVFLFYAYTSKLDHAKALEAALEGAESKTFRDETEIADVEALPVSMASGVTKLLPAQRLTLSLAVHMPSTCSRDLVDTRTCA
jgi:hypothetical protein